MLKWVYINTLMEVYHSLDENRKFEYFVNNIVMYDDLAGKIDAIVSVLNQ